MTEAWYIDSLDARAGLAFASYRPADLMADKANLPDVFSSDLDLPAVFIEPPGFRPDPVSGRAVAFVASKGSFQFGLFLGEQEVAFPTLEDVVEFVRRTYLRGGGGDGAGGIGPGVPPVPEGGPEGETPEDLVPRTELGRGVEGDVLRLLLADVQAHWLDKDENGARPAGTAFVPGEPIKTELFSPGFHRQALSDEAGAQALTRAALELVLELLRRFPISGNDQQLLDWFARSQSLGSSIATLGLWRELLDRPFWPLLRWATDRMWRRVHGRIRSKFPPWASEHAATERKESLLIDLLFGRLDAWYLGYRMWPGRHDPLDDLSSWPLPPDVAALTDARRPDKASLCDLLNAVVGSPQVLGRGKRHDTAERAAALVLYASVHITVEAALLPRMPFSDTDLNRARLGQSLKVGGDWLAQQFPKRIFPEAVENAIAGASRLAYA